MKALKGEVLRRLDGGGFSIQPPVHEHESNGGVENGVKIFKGLFRVHLLALERKIDAHIPIDHPILCWLVEFVGDLASKYLVSVDGKTGYERLFGKKVREEQLEFGELVLWRKPRLQDYGVVAEARWETGVWVGRRWSTPIHFVSFNDRVVECRAAQRVPKADRWKRDAIDAVRATRWANPAPAFDVAVPVVLPGPGEPLPAAPARREYAPRHVFFRMEDLLKWGRTAGCRRCTLMTNGEPAKDTPHTRACSDRIEQATKDDGDERFFAAEARLNQRLGPGDEASEAELPAEEECGAGPSAPAVPEAPAMDPAAVTSGDDGDWVDGDGPDADVAGASGGRLQPPTDCSMQVEEVAREEMLDGVFKSWPCQCGKEATELLDLLLVHGAEPWLVNTKIAELFSLPLPRVGWNFLRADHRRVVCRQLYRERPYLVVGAPLSRNLRAPGMEATTRRVEAGILLRFAMEVYQFQLDCENHFLHEHPLGTDEWQISEILRLRKGSCVHKVSSSCMPSFFSSSPAVMEQLYSRCLEGSVHCPAMPLQGSAAGHRQAVSSRRSRATTVGSPRSQTRQGPL